jgi:hypothetical protein
MKAYDLEASQLITIETVVSSSEDVTIQTDGEAHYLRFDVLALLDDIASGKQTYEHYLEMIVTCTSDIHVYREKHAHPLWDLLLNELDRALKTLKFPHMYHRNISKQHGAYLGMMRGTSSQSPNELPSNHYNVFSNGLQHALSHELSREVTESINVAFGSVAGSAGSTTATAATAATTATAATAATAATTAATASFMEPTGGSSVSFATAMMQSRQPQRKWAHGGLSLARTTTCAMPAAFPESTFMWNPSGEALPRLNRHASSSGGIPEDTMGQDGTQPGF